MTPTRVQKTTLDFIMFAINDIASATQIIKILVVLALRMGVDKFESSLGELQKRHQVHRNAY